MKPTNEEMKIIYKAIDAQIRAIYDYNNELLYKIDKEYMKDFNDLLDGSNVTDKIEVVIKPRGDRTDENIGIFKNIHVEQWTTGIEGDSFAGFIYAEISKNKWLKIPYEY